jgi:hypothetical protein
MRRLSQLLVLALLSASILLYQFLQPAIGGKGQFLKASCHRGGPYKAALKGILLDSAAMKSRGSEVPTVPRKYNVELTSVWIKSSVESFYHRKTEGEIWGRSWKNNAEWTLRGWSLPERLDFDLPLKIWAWGKDDLGFGSGRRPRRVARRKNRCWTDLTWRCWRL